MPSQPIPAFHIPVNEYTHCIPYQALDGIPLARGEFLAEYAFIIEGITVIKFWKIGVKAPVETLTLNLAQRTSVWAAWLVWVMPVIKNFPSESSMAVRAS
jgi:hypothetical protein